MLGSWVIFLAVRPFAYSRADYAIFLPNFTKGVKKAIILKSISKG
ncbi:hypothetical protein CAMSH0001_1294 [Campylobacter showae RM3277]|uniref:Uncharacterized protein n=1 Tax=Campylobacter showae RM3277 TaxID=553219 RepID=C6RIE8_9BACT|nr:hypothetical protein CAMSH0001_1294 [Campylobacter showae RM3277]